MKRCISFFITLLLLFNSLAFAAVAGGDYPKGDVSKSGEIDMMDYILVKRAYFGTFRFTDEQNDIADLNHSGTLDMMDYVLLKRIYFGTFKYVEPPEVDDGNGDEQGSTADESPPNNPTMPSVPITPGSPTKPEEPKDEKPDTEDIIMRKGTLISVGKPYTLTAAPSASYPDYFNQQLTDGVHGPNSGAFYTDPRTVGFERTAEIIIDLGDDGKNITEVLVRAIDMSMDGVGLPRYIYAYGSNDGENFTAIDFSYFESTGDKTMSSCSVVLDEPADYRYIKVFVQGDSRYYFVFLDEVEVYADVEPKEPADTLETTYANENIDKDAYLALSTGTAATPVVNDNVALGCKYSFNNCQFDYRAPRNDVYLTDGERTSRLFGEKAFVGITSDGTKIPEVTVTLNNTYDNIYTIKAFALGAAINVKYPDYIDAFGSTDGRNYVFLGRMYAPAECEHYAYTLMFTEYIKARYIKLQFPTEQANYWIEEIQVLAGYNEKQDNSMYPEVCIETVTEDRYWFASTDFKTSQNLLIGADQQIAAMYNDDKSVMTDTRETSPYNFPGLADGKRARSTNCYSGEYFFSVNTTNETIGFSNCLDFFYDVGYISSFTEFNVHLLEHTEIGITRPSFMSVYLSNDADNWYKVGDYRMPDDVVFNRKAKQLSFNFPLEKTYAARFVRFRVEEPKNARFIFIDELEAIGTKYVGEDATLITESGLESYVYYTNAERAQYATLENTTVKSQDQVLFIPDYGDKDTLLPLVAYLDEEGNIKDTMFDGFICWGAKSYPRAQYSFSESYKEDWEHLFDVTFNGINGLDRLDEVVGQVKAKLNIPDYKVKVYFSTLRIHESVTDFGDIDGDGITENLSKLEDRAKVINWYLDKNINEFNKRGYKNLVLDGVNYIDESVYLEEDNSYLIKEIGDAVKAKGLNYIWIPFYVAPRWYIGEELGFDAVCMQMNYVFTNNAPDWRLSTTAEFTKRLGMSIEMEHTYQCFGDKYFARQYMKYMLGGVRYGYMNAIQMYFMDNDDYTRMGYSKDPLCRLQYDCTYEYIKDRLVVDPVKKADFNAETAVNTILRGNLNPNKALELYTLASAPKHGIVSLNEDGGFIYYPEKGYEGVDSFTYTYNEYLGESVECVVNITVG